MVIIIVIQLLKDIAVRAFNADVQLSPGCYRPAEANMMYPRQPRAQVRYRLFSVIDQDQLGVLISLPLKAAERLGNELVAAFGCHNTRDKSGRLTVRTASRI